MPLALGRVPAHIVRYFELFFAAEASGGLSLLLATICALAWANVATSSYAQFWGSFHLETIVNDGLMTIFFFVVGLEIKRELRKGELSEPRQAALPILSAAGGAIAPALIYLLWNRGSSGVHGWGVPMATDIAFAVGIMAVLGSRVPVGAKVFLTALAIADDLMAVVVIACFYTRSLHWSAAGWAAACLMVLYLMNRLNVQWTALYLGVGAVLWYFTWKSGIHSTIAGVLLATTIPLSGEPSMLERLEERLHPFVTFAVMPLFALANSGLSLRGGADEITAPVALGVICGLVFGKTLGITGAAWLAVRLRWGALPALVNWQQLHAISWLGGIGFTMSLFIAHLAFHNGAMLREAKLGIFAGSLLAGAIGSVLLWMQSRSRANPATR